MQCQIKAHSTRSTRSTRHLCDPFRLALALSQLGLQFGDLVPQDLRFGEMRGVLCAQRVECEITMRQLTEGEVGEREGTDDIKFS